MKRRQKAAWFLSGVVAAALTASLTSPALAALAVQTIQVYTGVDIYVDDVKLEPTDANGNPVEAFVHNGTTYLPVRAVSEAVGKDVKWEGNTSSVYIGRHAGDSSYLLSVCPPYESDNYNTESTYTMMGKKYANGFTLGERGWLTDGWCLFNLNGQYDTLSFDIGHVDGWGGGGATYNIYLDGELAYSVDVTSEMIPEHHEIDLNGAVQMKIVGEHGEGGYPYAFAMVNIQVS